MGYMVVDALINLITGMGITGRDKSTGAKHLFTILPDDQLLAAYRSDWVARKVIDIPAYDATREWRAWQADKSAIEKIETVEKVLQIKPKTMRVLQRSRLWGGALLLLGIDGAGENDQPLELDKIKQGALKFVHVVSRSDISPGHIEEDLASPFYGEPQYYERSNAQGYLKMHPSRVVRLIGNEIPDERLSNGWGDSSLQTVYEAILQMGTVSGSIATLVQESKIDVIKIPELSVRMANKEYADRLVSRFELTKLLKGVQSLLLLDKEEEWQRITASFTALPDVLKLYLLIACGAADIPATRMLGQTAVGLNSTGESDIRNYYDRVAADQKLRSETALNRLDEVLIRSALGSRDPTIFYNWNSLWQMTPEQKADLENKKANTFKIDVDANIIEPEILRAARINQLTEDGTYPGIERAVEEFGLEPEDRAQMREGPSDDPEEEVAAIDAVTRIRDARPRTAYVRRDVLNAAAIIAWAKSQGFTSTVPAEEMHVTIMYSRAEFDWMKVGESWLEDADGNVVIKGSGVRLVEQLGVEGAVVLMFTSSQLSGRHEQIKWAGATWDHEEYQPHITITYQGAPANLDTIVPYRGVIKLGPEIWQEISPAKRARER